MKRAIFVLFLMMFFATVVDAKLDCGNSCESAGACISNGAVLFEKNIKCDNGVWKNIDTSKVVTLDSEGNVISNINPISTSGGEIVSSFEPTVCCEKTNSGLSCLDVSEEDCAPGSRSFPTSCASTTFCNPGYCVGAVEGTCLDGVPQINCNPEEGGSWFAEKPAQCDLGCCVIGDQPSFVTKNRCKRLSGLYGVETNYNPSITSEQACTLIASSSEKGACVFEEDSERTCKITTRGECSNNEISGGNNVGVSGADLGLGGAVTNKRDSNAGTSSSDSSGGNSNGAPQTSPSGCVSVGNGKEFCPGLLCSAEALNTNCGPTEETTCVPGKEEIYFVDSCGNPANIYDGSKIHDVSYWSNIKDKGESCSPDSGNINSQSCGNCNYLFGSFCGNAKEVNPTYGNNICQNLNCEASEKTGGKKRIHGESWCGYDEDVNFVPEKNPTSSEDNVKNAIDSVVRVTTDKLGSALRDALASAKAGKGAGIDFLKSSGGSVGSRYVRYICINGEVTVEPCADFRQEECIENVKKTNLGDFSEAECKVNRWQQCAAQTNKQDCTNTDIRDCKWLDGIAYVLMGSVPKSGDGSNSADAGSISNARQILEKLGSGERDTGACVPKIPPGLKYWKGEEAKKYCSQANAFCPVTYEKGALGGSWKCVKNCDCLPGGSLELQRIQLCTALGDCGPKTNFVGEKGRGLSYKTTIKKTKNKN